MAGGLNTTVTASLSLLGMEHELASLDLVTVQDCGEADNYGGYAWYIRTFDVPADFPTEDLTMAVGYFDEANETYVNGHLIGSSGMRYDIAPENVGIYSRLFSRRRMLCRRISEPGKQPV